MLLLSYILPTINCGFSDANRILNNHPLGSARGSHSHHNADLVSYPNN